MNKIQTTYVLDYCELLVQHLSTMTIKHKFLNFRMGYIEKISYLFFSQFLSKQLMKTEYELTISLLQPVELVLLESKE